MNFNFFMPARFLTGTDCVHSNAKLLCRFGRKCLIMTGSASAKRCGALDDVTAALEEQDITWTVFDRVEQNPTLITCKQAGDQARETGADFIIGIGGGSPLDAAKAAIVYAANPGLELMDIYRLDWPNPALPLVLVGTTAGTGSEVDAASVLTMPDGHKKSITHDDCFPKLSFGDPKYTASLPRAFTVSTALDALSHAIEGYFSLGANDLSDVFAIQAVAMLHPQLALLQDEKKEISFASREQLYYASILAGFALGKCGTCYCHNLGYHLTEEYGVAHGTACAVFLENFIQRASRLMPERADYLFERAGIDEEDLCLLIAALLEDLSHIHLMPDTIRQVAKEGAQTNSFVRTAPAGYTALEAEELMTRLFGA